MDGSNWENRRGGLQSGHSALLVFIPYRNIKLVSHVSGKSALYGNHMCSYHMCSYHMRSYHMCSYHMCSYDVCSYHMCSYDMCSYHM